MNRIFEVTITQGIIKPLGGVESPLERTFTIRARTAKSAIKAIKDAGIRFDTIVNVQAKR